MFSNNHLLILLRHLSSATLYTHRKIIIFLILPFFITVIPLFNCAKQTGLLKVPDFYTISIITVEEWGGTQYEDTGSKHKPKMLTLHHGGTDWLDGRDPKEYLRDLQQWSRNEKKWPDIPYHYMIDIDGNIYEARNPLYPGDTNTSYDPKGHIITCVMGNYEKRRPTVEQLEAIINLLAWQCDEFDISPETLKGHKDYADTLCPGKNLYSYISGGFLEHEIKRRVGKVRIQNYR